MKFLHSAWMAGEVPLRCVEAREVPPRYVDALRSPSAVSVNPGEIPLLQCMDSLGRVLYQSNIKSWNFLCKTVDI